MATEVKRAAGRCAYERTSPRESGSARTRSSSCSRSSSARASTGGLSDDEATLMAVVLGGEHFADEILIPAPP